MYTPIYVSYVYVKWLQKEKLNLSLSGSLHLLSACANVAVNRNHRRDDSRRELSSFESGTVTYLVQNWPRRLTIEVYM